MKNQSQLKVQISTNRLRIANLRKAIKIKDRAFLKYFRKKNKKKSFPPKTWKLMLMRKSTNFQKMMNKVMK